MGISIEPRSSTASTTPGRSGLRQGARCMSTRWRPSPSQLVVVLVVLGATLRFATLDVQSVWGDETATIMLVRRGLSGALSHLATNESAPPLYYVLVWGWTKVFGVSIVGFRSFSALVGTLTLPVLYVAGQRISTRVGLWAAAIASVNPMMYYYSQEARSYALLILLSGVALIAWQRVLEAPSKLGFSLWAGASVLALLTHYFAVFMFVPEASILAWRWGWRRVCPPGAAVILVGAALVPLALRQRASGNSDWIQSTSLLSRVAQFPKQFFVGLYGPWELITTLGAAALAVVAVVAFARRASERERRLTLLLALVGIGAIALPLALAVTHVTDVFNGRNVIAAWIPWAVVLAAALGAARAPRLSTALGLLLCLVFAVVIAATDALPQYQRDDWRGIASVLRARVTSRVLVSPDLSSGTLQIYDPGLVSVGTSTVVTSEIDFAAVRTPRTGRSPLPASVPLSPPPGFRLAGIRRASSYAISFFEAPRPTVARVGALQRMLGENHADVLHQP